MDLAIAAAVFPVIFLGELPDKAMIASMALSARGRAGLVTMRWNGTARPPGSRREQAGRRGKYAVVTRWRRRVRKAGGMDRTRR